VRTKTASQADKILDAAARLFGSQRFHEVRMEDVASEAEVGKGTIYRYFVDKEALYLALLRRASEQLLARIKHAVARAHGTRARLEAVVAAILATFDEQPHLLDVIQRAEVMQQPGTEFPWQKTRDDIGHLVNLLLEEGIRQGEWSIPDPELAVHLLLGGLRNVIRFGRRPRPADLPRRILANFVWEANRCPSWGESKVNGSATVVEDVSVS
jgi:AcrR family transcriptional regulator